MLHLAQLCHHMDMRRSGLLILTMLVLSAALLHAQRAGGGSHAGGFSGAGGRMSGHGARPGPSNGVFPRHPGGHRHNGYGYGYGAAWLPWDVPYWDDDGFFEDERSYPQPAPTTSPQVIVVENKEPPAPPPEPPKLIEVPQSKDAPVAKPQPPTLFVMKDGERLESRYYLLTAQSLHIEVGRQTREIPLATLDLDATMAANHERGIEVAIPRDRNTVFVSF
jgi:hypothetical protein